MHPTRRAAHTPHYVLLDGDLRIGPKVVPLDAHTECSVIYGFTSKGLYDDFCLQSQLALKPYPLVKGYLRSQIEAEGDRLNLVVIDATGPSQPCLDAATMKAVLEAQENLTTQVTVTYQLTFDEDAAAYRVDAQHEDEVERLNETHGTRHAND